MDQNLLLLIGFALLFGLISKRIDDSYVSGPIIFIAYAFIIGPTLLDLLEIDIDAELMKGLAEVTLALVLFVDAAHTHESMLKKNIGIPKRLLLVGLPLSIILGAVFAFLIFPTFSLVEIGLLAVILAPTDAALGKPVVSNPKVPDRIRQSLNVESGLNDGICVPFVVLGASLATPGSTSDAFEILMLFAKTIGIGGLAGILIAYLASLLINRAIKVESMSESWRSLLIVFVALLAYSSAEMSGGSGFIACFCGGFTFGHLNKAKIRSLASPAEGLGDFLSMCTWILFGVAVLPGYIQEFQWSWLLYALLSLTLIRILPVYLSLTGLKLQSKEKLFMGWFGPRGLASLVFAIMISDLGLTNGGNLIEIILTTILLSIFAHGLTANALINRLAESRKT